MNLFIPIFQISDQPLVIILKDSRVRSVSQICCGSWGATKALAMKILSIVYLT